MKSITVAAVRGEERKRERTTRGMYWKHGTVEGDWLRQSARRNQTKKSERKNKNKIGRPHLFGASSENANKSKARER